MCSAIQQTFQVMLMLMFLLLEHYLTKTLLCMTHNANLNGPQEWYDCTTWSDLNHFHCAIFPCGTSSMDLYRQLFDVTSLFHTCTEWNMLNWDV